MVVAKIFDTVQVFIGTDIEDVFVLHYDRGPGRYIGRCERIDEKGHTYQAIVVFVASQVIRKEQE